MTLILKRLSLELKQISAICFHPSENTFSRTYVNPELVWLSQTNLDFTEIHDNVL